MSNGSLLKPADTWKTYPDLTYTSVVTGSSAKLDLHVPDNGVASPLVGWFHGGAWSGGDKRETNGHFQYLLKAGFAVAAINYRLTTQAPWPAQLVDCKSAIRYLRSLPASYRLWTDKVGVWGASAGAQLASMLASTSGQAKFEQGGHLEQSSDVQAVTADYSPSDITRWLAEPATPNPYFVVALLLGKIPTPALTDPISPMDNISQDVPPTFLRHGSADKTVPPVQSTRYRDALLAAGVPVQHTVLPGLIHASADFYSQAKVAPVLTWFDNYLRP